MLFRKREPGSLRKHDPRCSAGQGGATEGRPLSEAHELHIELPRPRFRASCLTSVGLGSPCSALLWGWCRLEEESRDRHSLGDCCGDAVTDGPSSGLEVHPVAAGIDQR